MIVYILDTNNLKTNFTKIFGMSYQGTQASDDQHPPTDKTLDFLTDIESIQIPPSHCRPTKPHHIRTAVRHC